MAKKVNKESTASATFEAPELDYLPSDPKDYRPPIALVGCGGITEHHLQAYQQAGYDVVALCDVDATKAQERQRQFYPHAKIYEDYRDVLARDDIEVVDIATHPPQRVELIEAALRAGKHVLSQKPFVTDLDVGERLIELADRHQVILAVNQNGRWAPYFSYMRQAARAGLIGDVQAAHFNVDWDHNWVAGTEFEKIKHLILYFARKSTTRIILTASKHGRQQFTLNSRGEFPVPRHARADESLSRGREVTNRFQHRGHRDHRGRKNGRKEERTEGV